MQRLPLFARLCYSFFMTKLERLRAHAREIFLAGTQGADPAAAVRSFLEIRADLLRVGERTYDLKECRNLYLAGCGKAGMPMARAALEIFDERISHGVLVVQYGHKHPLRRIDVLEAAHPIPDEAGVEGARRVMDLARRCEREDLLLFLLSGGASALLPCPAAGISLADKQRATNALLRSGATIHEINAVRKHLSRVKGGRLAKRAAPARLVSLILSDVIDDSLETVGSGPTAPDPTTFGDSLRILERYRLAHEIPSSVLALLSRGARQEIPETAKPSDPVFHRVQNVVIGSNRTAVAAAQERAAALGYRVSILTEPTQGESRAAAVIHAERVRKIVRENAPRPACLISGGETTVTVRGGGIGGRNQEFALAAALAIGKLDDVVILSGGTDGIDGPTDAAGGIVDGWTIARAHAAGLDPTMFLDRNDAYNLLRAVGDLLITGPTSTNVMDLQITLLG